MKKTNKDEEIGFHKGALSTLAKERMELIKVVQITEQLMGAHVKALKDLGIDIEAEAKKAQAEMQKTQNQKLDEKL